MSELLINTEATAIFDPQTSSVFTFERKSIQPTNTPSTPLVDNTTSSIQTSGKIAYWGDNNLFPQEVIEDIEFNSIVGTTIDWKARVLYGQGLATYRFTGYDDDGNEILKRERFKPFEDFAKRTNLKRYLIEALTDLYTFYNVFPEVVLSKDRKEALFLSVQEAAYCRWGLQNPKTGLVEKCYVNAQWESGATETNSKTITIPVVDPYYDPVEQIKGAQDYKYIYPISYPTPGKSYYQLAHWNSIRKGGWLELAKAIPQFKKSMMNNQLNIKYHIQVADYFWSWKYPDWNTYSNEKKTELKKNEIDMFKKFFSGPSKSGGTLFTGFKFDPANNREYPGWKITPIDDTMKEGAYIEDSQEASSHILYALGVDGTLIGSAPGKGMGAGSGSDKKAAYNIYLSTVAIHEDIILEPIRFIHDYNGWDPDIVYRFPRNYLKDDNQKAPAERNPVIGNGTV